MVANIFTNAAAFNTLALGSGRMVGQPKVIQAASNRLNWQMVTIDQFPFQDVPYHAAS